MFIQCFTVKLLVKLMKTKFGSFLGKMLINLKFIAIYGIYKVKRRNNIVVHLILVLFMIPHTSLHVTYFLLYTQYSERGSGHFDNVITDDSTTVEIVSRSCLTTY